ncbi:MAG: metalloregulator ArsR/SmtB family transcription factor [Gammaproteobacteria bacterium]|nr:metalloregulator ArsR/SmtB family transcription factor [Gammaproteobacteria bacterium]
MANSRTTQIDDTFYALSDPTRRAIVARLADGEATVGELAEPFALSAPAMTKHLRVLERVGLLAQRRVGRTRRCALLAAPLVEAAQFFSRYASYSESQLDAVTSSAKEQPATSKD